MSLSNDIKFQKALALAASASNKFEAEAAERAARRLMATHNIDPTDIPDGSLYNRMNFAENALLRKLREEWRKAHPQPVNTKKRKGVNTKKAKPKPKPAGTPVNTSKSRANPFADLSFEDFGKEPAVNTSSDRNADRHSPGYMRDYMRRRRARSR